MRSGVITTRGVPRRGVLANSYALFLLVEVQGTHLNLINLEAKCPSPDNFAGWKMYLGLCETGGLELVCFL